MYYESDELTHYGVKGMKWGVRKKVGDAYKKSMRNLGGTKFAKNAVTNSKYLNDAGKKQALEDNAYLSAKKKAKRTGGTITYDVATGKYTVDKPDKKQIKADKKQAKVDYKAAKKAARDKRYDAYEKADSAYEKATSKQTKGLKKVDDDYATKQKTIDAHYKKELEKPQSEVDSAKRSMDYYKRRMEDERYKDYYNSSEKWHKYYSDEYDKRSKALSEVQSRYDAATTANKIARDQAAIKVRDLNYKTVEKASATREAAYAKAGDEYVKSLNLAKMTYKEAKRNIKNSK